MAPQPQPTSSRRLVRGLVRQETDRVGNFWSDLARGLVRVLAREVGGSEPSAGQRAPRQHAHAIPLRYRQQVRLDAVGKQ